MNQKMNPWRSISGAVCFNVFNGLVEGEPESMNDLVYPLACCLYLAEHWDQLNFSKTDDLVNLRGNVARDVMEMKEILIKESSSVASKVESYLDHLNGSLAFVVVVVEATYNGNQSIYRDNLRTLFQDCWETIFWFVQDLKDKSVRQLICDYTEHHSLVFDKMIDHVNMMNPK